MRRNASFVIVVATLLGATPRVHAETWKNHIDASLINEIVPRGDVLYMATFGGLVLYDVAAGTFDRYDNISGLPSNALTCLAFDGSGNIYIGTEDIGVTKVRISNGRLILLRALSEQIDGLASNRINSIAPWGADIVYGSSPGAGTIRNDFASARYFARDGLPADDVLDVLVDGDYVWMATSGGAAVLDRFGLIRVPTGAPPQAAVLGTDGTRIWVGTNDGVRRFDPADSSWTDVGPDTREMHSLAWDGATMWGGSIRTNFFRYSGTGQTWTEFRADSILARYQLGNPNQNEERGLAVMPGGDVFLGTAQPGDRRGVNLLRFDGTRITNLIPNGPGENIILRLSLDRDESVWACFSGFYVGKLTRSGSWVNYNGSNPGITLPSNQYTNLSLLADSDGVKWMCTLSTPTSPRPLDVLDDKLDADFGNDSWQRLSIGSPGGDGLGSLRLQRGVEDPAGNRWFLSDDQERASGWWGIQILSKDRSEWFQMTPSKDARMLSGNVTDVAFGDRFAYVGLRKAGVQVWRHEGYDWANLSNASDDGWSRVVTLPGDLPGEADVLALSRRSDGVLWIATTSGLYRYAVGETSEIPVYAGTGTGILSPKVNDIVLDHEENLWVATELGLNRIARDDDNDIQAFTSTAAYVTLSGLRYPLSVISPLANANCLSLAMHPTRDALYIGTFGGLSILDFTAAAPTATDLSRVYVYPNPVYGRRGDSSLKIENITGPVSIDIYNLEGEVVHSTTASDPGEVIWDLTTRNGYYVGSGNYLVRISGPGGSVTKPLAVLR